MNGIHMFNMLLVFSLSLFVFEYGRDAFMSED